MPAIEDNALLRRLSPASRQALEPTLEAKRLDLNRTLFEEGDAVEWVWFPTSALLSQITTGAGGQTVETSMVGTDGALGLVEALGSGEVAFNAVVQVDGHAWCAPAGVCRHLARSDAEFAQLSWSMAEMQLIESRQSGLCQAHHGVESRLARWLAESVERVGDGRTTLPLTQEFMAAMLGVQRTTVNAFATQLQKAGLIRYSRGRMDICDMAGLARRACECRDVIREHRERLGLSVPGERERRTEAMTLTG